MAARETIINDLVIANRILAHENVVDAFGHVSHRHPDDAGLYLLSRSRSPELRSRHHNVAVPCFKNDV